MQRLVACRGAAHSPRGSPDKEVLPQPTAASRTALLDTDLRRAAASPARATALRQALEDVRRSVDAALAVLADAAGGKDPASATGKHKGDVAADEAARKQAGTSAMEGGAAAVRTVRPHHTPWGRYAQAGSLSVLVHRRHW
jgi:hypothetical protein